MNKVDEIMNMQTSKQDFDLIIKIVARAQDLGLIIETREVMPLIMDLDNTHKICPLDLFALLNYFNNFSFAHDIYGIQQNFNRKTYEIDNCFLPRCAKK